MKHLKSYEERINEELTRDQRTWLNLPRFLSAFIGKKLFGIYPLLNFRWSEMKKKTTNSKYPSLVSSASGFPNKMEEDLTKITKGDLPSNRMGAGMFLRDWNIYLSNRKSKGGSSIERPVVYITKDEINKGDMYHGERLSDGDVFPEFKFNGRGKGYTNPDNIKDYPLIIMITKFDNASKIKDMEKYVDDICLELEDDFLVSAEPHFDLHGDYLYVDLKILEGRSIKFNDDIDNRLNEVASRIVDYLKMEKFKGFNYKVKYYIKRPFYYTGNKDRFSKIIDIASKWSNRYEQDYDYPLWNRHKKCLDISRLGEQHSESELELTGDDIRTLLSDLDNCKKIQPSSTGVLRVPDKKDNIVEVELRAISIKLKKNS